MSTAPVLHTRQRVFVQTSTNFTAWTTQLDWQATEAAEGACNDCGTARISQRLGYVIKPGTKLITDVAPDSSLIPSTSSSQLSMPGRWVRLLLESLDGAEIITDADTTQATCKPFWYGEITGASFVADGAGTRIDYAAQGMLGALAGVTFRSWYEIGYDAGGTVGTADPGEVFTFNGHEEGAGDRSTTTSSIGGGSAYRHDRTLMNASKWTAQTALTLILGAVNDQAPGGPTWQLAAPSGAPVDYLERALGYSEVWDINGMSAQEIIARILSPRRGIAYRIRVEGAVANIEINTCLTADATIGTLVIPAAIRRPVLDVSGVGPVVSYTESHDQTYDIVGASGNRRLYAITVGYKPDGTGQLVKGWDTSLEAGWTAANDEQRALAPFNSVHTTFVFKNGWKGESYSGGAGWATKREALGTEGAPHVLYGATGESGELSGDVGFWSSGRNIKLASSLPLFEGYQWDNVALADVNHGRPLMRPDVYRVSGTNWERINATFSFDERQGGIRFESGPELAAEFEGMFASGEHLVITLGVYHPLPLRVTWQRPAAERPRAMPRVFIQPMPRIERWTLLADTVTRLSATGTPVTRGAEIDIINNTDRLREAVALMRPFYATPARTVTVTSRGLLDITDVRSPGALPTTIDVPYSRTGNYLTLPVDNIITRRAWSFSDTERCTTYTTARIGASLEAVR